MTLSGGKQIDVTTGLEYVDPSSLIRLANGAYIDTKKNVMTEPDGTKIDVNKVAEILKKNEISPAVLRRVMEELNLAAQPDPGVASASALTFENSSFACLRVMSIVASGVRVRPEASPSTTKNEMPSVPVVPAVRATTTIRTATIKA